MRHVGRQQEAGAERTYLITYYIKVRGLDRELRDRARALRRHMQSVLAWRT